MLRVAAGFVAASFVAMLFGAYDQVSTVSALTALPIALWEFTIGAWMIAKGFRDPATVGTRTDRAGAPHHVAA